MSNTSILPQRPNSDDYNAWRNYWQVLGQPWRTKPEIESDRKMYLAERRRITPDIQQGVYPFRDIKLSRADIEWLLATHQDASGPVEWSAKLQRKGEGLDLRGADLRQADLHGLPLACIKGGLDQREWIRANLEQRDMAGVHLKGANLQEAHLEGADLCRAHLEGANLREAHLEGADLYRAHLEGTYLRKAYLGGTSLRKAFCDEATTFDGVSLWDKELGCTLVSDAHWGDTNLSNIDWKRVKWLGDDYEAKRSRWSGGGKKSLEERLASHKRAVRANRQLAALLKEQGLSEEALRFSYQAQVLQRRVLWHQRQFGQYCFSLFLDLFTGYGYKPLRSFITYIIVICTFMIIYHFQGIVYGPPLTWRESLVVSMTAFHGRGFFSNQFKPSDPQAMAAAIQAFVGLVIEVIFIATLTKRLFRD